jgi:hypothetical protein
MAAKKRAAPFRAPRELWIVTGEAHVHGVRLTKKAAQDLFDEVLARKIDGHRVVGPYVLAERVRER